jgi:hypothetical protein
MPLCLLRNLESLFAVSTASILFYVFVMLHIIFSARYLAVGSLVFIMISIGPDWAQAFTK